LGIKSLACAAVGAYYNPMASYPTELADEIGLQLVDPSTHGDGKHDIILCDNYFKRQDLEQAMTWRDKCNEMLVFVKHDQMEARIKYQPKQIIKIRTTPASKKTFTPDYLFYFHN